MKDICLVLMIGLPAAGKTTFCHKLIQWIDQSLFNIKMYNFDEYLVQFEYHNSRKRLNNIIKEDIYSSLKENLKAPLLFLLDDNMMYHSMRNFYLNLARECEISCAMVYFDISLELAMERNRHRINKVPDNILLKMNQVLKQPQNSYVINSVDYNQSLFDDFMEYIKKSLNNPLKLQQKPIQLLVTQSSHKHKIDLILRNIVNKKIKQNKSWMAIDVMKRNIFDKYKKGDLTINASWSEDQIEQFLEHFFV